MKRVENWIRARNGLHTLVVTAFLPQQWLIVIFLANRILIFIMRQDCSLWIMEIITIMTCSTNTGYKYDHILQSSLPLIIQASIGLISRKSYYLLQRFLGLDSRQMGHFSSRNLWLDPLVTAILCLLYSTVHSLKLQWCPFWGTRLQLPLLIFPSSALVL